ncbi:MAG TPA: MFS transporter [Candidatus Limnocylindria bacterium]|nr:MFS transporter [Candidatus Limnocylindria bacterium]
MSHAAPPPGNASERPLLPFSHLLKLSVYWFGILTIWGGLNNIILPSRIEDIDKANAGTLLAIINGAAVLMAIVVQPTIGMISDYTVTRWGRRKPYIVIGATLDVVFLIGLALSQTYLMILVFLVLLQFSSNFAQGPFQGYVPDLVPAKQVATASGLMGVMIVMGQIAGVGVATLGLGGDLVLATIGLGLIELATAIVLVTSVREGSGAPPRRVSWLRVAGSAWGTDILKESNVLWLLLVRLLFLGAVNATNLGLYYFQRTHGMPEEEAGTILFIATLVVGVATAASAFPGARLSDRFGRRPMIWAACAIAASGMLLVALAPSPWLAIGAFLPFGIGVGIFLSVDWALMTDVIPKDTTGRYMGILNAGTAAAGPVFLFVAGQVLDRVGKVDVASGPRAAMGVAALFLVAAGIALLRVDPTRREAVTSFAEPEPTAAA